MKKVITLNIVKEYFDNLTPKQIYMYINYDENHNENNNNNIIKIKEEFEF